MHWSGASSGDLEASVQWAGRLKWGFSPHVASNRHSLQSLDESRDIATRLTMDKVEISTQCLPLAVKVLTQLIYCAHIRGPYQQWVSNHKLTYTWCREQNRKFADCLGNHHDAMILDSEIVPKLLLLHLISQKLQEGGAGVRLSAAGTGLAKFRVNVVNLVSVDS